MKTLIKLRGLVMSVLIFSAILSACEGNVSDGNISDNTNDPANTADMISEIGTDTAQNGMEEIGSGIKNTVDDMGDSLEAAKNKVADALGMNGGVTEDKIREAVDFINSHIDDDIKTAGRDVREKFVYYAEYLRQTGERSGNGSEIKTLGDKCGKLVNTLMSNSDADVSDIRREIKSSLEKINADKDNMIKSAADDYNK